MDDDLLKKREALFAHVEAIAARGKTQGKVATTPKKSSKAAAKNKITPPLAQERLKNGAKNNYRRVLKHADQHMPVARGWGFIFLGGLAVIIVVGFVLVVTVKGGVKQEGVFNTAIFGQNTQGQSAEGNLGTVTIYNQNHQTLEGAPPQ